MTDAALDDLIPESQSLARILWLPKRQGNVVSHAVSQHPTGGLD